MMSGSAALVVLMVVMMVIVCGGMMIDGGPFIVASTATTLTSDGLSAAAPTRPNVKYSSEPRGSNGVPPGRFSALGRTPFEATIRANGRQTTRLSHSGWPRGRRDHGTETVAIASFESTLVHSLCDWAACCWPVPKSASDHSTQSDVSIDEIVDEAAQMALLAAIGTDRASS